MILRYIAGLSLAVCACAQVVTVNYSARIIVGAGTAVAYSDFLTTFGLKEGAGPEGPEVRFSGAFTFDPSPTTNPNRVIGTGAQARNGRYALSSFQINGVPLRRASSPLSAGTPSMTIDVSCCRTGVGQDDLYVVSLS